MSFSEDFKRSLSAINEQTFVNSSLKAFEYQYRHGTIYRQYCDSLYKTPNNVKELYDIPFMPIEFFKNHAIKSGDWKETKVFKSSGTTRTGRSQHFVKNEHFYQEKSSEVFIQKFGDLKEMRIIALLPSYQEQGDSSLISMVDHLISMGHKDSGYFLNSNVRDLLRQPGKKIIIGVSYALLELASDKAEVVDTIVIETGGMKGRRKEIIRDELHNLLIESFDLTEIWSEYGMTELMSQAYGKKGLFELPLWAKCLIRDINDPFSYLPDGKSGGINIIDLANIDTCCFIETKDLGRATGKYFEVLGRFDNSDVRGCNLLI
ncbi:acyl transferase [Ekhidna sp.]|uniref:LuxE/PaaK family acyltransferase n=1 Tax=Ekhidna sp. TaxID=2608089 RepID=UPI0032974172